MARKQTIQKKEKSKTLLIEENKLSNVKEQRKALEKTFQGLEGFIAVAKDKLKGLKRKIINSDNLLKQKGKEFDLKNKKIAIARNTLNDTENKTLKLNNDQRTKKEENEKDLLILNEDLKEIKNDIVEQSINFSRSKKIFEDKEIEIKERIKQKILSSEQLDIDIENKKREIEQLKEVHNIKNDKTIILNNSIKSKKEIVKGLKNRINNLEEIKNKKQRQIKIVNSELTETEKEKMEKDKELESTKSKISLILKKEAVNNMKEKKLKEEYKKIGL